MFKKIFFLLIFLLLFITPVFAQEQIDIFNTEIRINQDSSINVVERITYNFSDNQKHGIFRTIPYKYKNSKGSFKLNISDIKVVDSGGRAYDFEVSEQGKNKNIKIGLDDKYVSGKKMYVISYRVERAINFLKIHDELYWNVTGNEWPVEIKRVEAKIFFPESFTYAEIQTDCFTGFFGSTEKCLSDNYSYPEDSRTDNYIYFHNNLRAGEGLTIVAGLPKDIIERPGLLTRIKNIIKDNFILLLPIIVFIILYNLWYTRGKDPEGQGVIIAQFEAPDNLTPSEVGTIIDEKAHKKDISADIINLAIKGYIRITRFKKDNILFKTTDYLFEQLKQPETLQNNFEKKLLKSLFNNNDDKTSNDLIKKLNNTNADKNSFSFKLITKILNSVTVAKEVIKSKTDNKIVKLSSLKNSFYKDLAEIEENIYAATVKKGYFFKSPKKVRNFYIGLGFFVLFVGLQFGGLLGLLGIFSVIITGALIILFGFIMPKKTKKGALTRECILGLKEYLRVAEKDRIKFHNAPKKNPKIFEKLLPYAMVLGVETEWASQFKDLYNASPDWYADSTGASFSSMNLTNNLGVFAAKANTALSSKPSSASSGGSGFSGGGSGGGFGGGGGGSW